MSDGGGVRCDGEQQLSVLSPGEVSISLTFVVETGGLFRIAIKLMMACATRNVTV